ncbi:hypothetical protein M408DRAFT_201150 [Serendipita vermifera MAFF 305830]|uniref:tRNA (guanine(9)-N1)-methyltransferase n=1 Tax=Serendipita vermifera MAFF 305830 TaxID=933852 RepID=A0A0C3AMQ3_SERVB|nr:hypothetical protein M408DRAFT_201150 [Serendipita vermifera MAFF 305830]
MNSSQVSSPPIATQDLDATETEPAQEPIQPLSKNAKKRILKAQKREEFKLERRAKEKAAKAAKKAAKREQAEANKAKEEQVEEGEENEPSTKKRKLVDGAALPVQTLSEESDNKVEVKTPSQVRKEPFGAKIVIDLGFDDKMTDREIISIVSQCAYCYSSNRKSLHPFAALLFTSLNGRTKARMDMLATYQNWKSVEWWEEGYNLLWENLAPAGTDEMTLGREYTCPVTSVAKPRTSTPKENVVYLTADSDVELMELNPEDTYIIGGIVDKNRYKALCENKARAQSIRTARLPIGIYLKELPTRKVLTVNQVLDILLNWVEHRDWKKAFFDVIPPRKFEAVGKNARRRKQKAEGNDGEEDEQMEDEDETPTGDGIADSTHD